jgi:peptidoglycan/xylan/chitin deacetylase (PgdA/CDA1 family)
MSKVNIVMYHYVRPVKNSKYPNIKGLEIEGFKRQLDFFQKNFEILKAEDLIAASKNLTKIPDNSCFLTFDDGYKDHYEYVLPELQKRKLQGSFFPPARPMLEKKLLDVNAIHFILASAQNIKDLTYDLIKECKKNEISDAQIDDMRKKNAKAFRYDNADIIFIKRLLQRELPYEVRQKVTKNLFEKYVGQSEEEFSEELYLSMSELKELVSNDMYVGSHTFNHFWLGSIDSHLQNIEIEKSIKFLSSIGAPIDDWIMCYPYGSYDNRTLDILAKKKCAIGLTTKLGIADFKSQNPLELYRWDTNDFPQ